jgi:hypothetical protein
MPGRLAGSIPVIATLVLAAMGVEAPSATAQAEDCLASPNSPAPKGSWWYYRLDSPTQRKCWYLRALGWPAKQTTERETGQPPSSGSASSEPTRPSDSADDSTPSLPAADTVTVGSIAREAIAAQASSGTPTNAPITPPAQNDGSAISASIQQSAHEEKAADAFQERPVQEKSASSQTDAQPLKRHRRMQHLELWHTLHRLTPPLQCPTTTLRGLPVAASRPLTSSRRYSYS